MSEWRFGFVITPRRRIPEQIKRLITQSPGHNVHSKLVLPAPFDADTGKYGYPSPVITPNDLPPRNQHLKNKQTKTA